MTPKVFAMLCDMAWNLGVSWYVYIHVGAAAGLVTITVLGALDRISRRLAK